MISRVVTNEYGTVLSEEAFSHDAAGNVTDACGCCTEYDSSNRLTIYNGIPVSYDADGNMVYNGDDSYVYDSKNRLISTNTSEYTYNAENVRIRNLCDGEETVYTYNTNCKLSQLLMKVTNGRVTKYVYGRGLIGEECEGVFKTYHFDYRGSTVAVTDINCNITDTFKYNAYGKCIERTGTSDIIFAYNGRDGVVTDKNGLIYMRARYYSPDMRRFINADIVAGDIANAVTLNRYAYANGNPVSFVDPMGLAVGRDPFGSINYNGIVYPIYVPNSIGTSDSESWKTISKITKSDFSFDIFEFITGSEFDDMDGIANGTGKALINNQQKANAGIASIFTGLLNSAANSSDSLFMTFVFQENGDQRRVIIKVGSSKAEQMYESCATGMPISAYINNYSDVIARGAISSYAMSLCEQATGVIGKWHEVYDIVVTVDSRHAEDNGYVSYLWISSHGNIMETPIVYENDKVEIGKRSGIFYYKFDPIVEVSIDESYQASTEYKQLFDVAK